MGSKHASGEKTLMGLLGIFLLSVMLKSFFWSHKFSHNKDLAMKKVHFYKKAF